MGEHNIPKNATTERPKRFAHDVCAFFAAMFVVFGLIPETFPYATLDAGPFTPVRWSSNSVAVFLDVRGGGGYGADELEPVLQDALATYNSVPCSRLTLYYGGLVTESVGSGIYIHFVDPFESPDIVAPDTAGITETYHDTAGNILRADMHLNSQYDWTLGGALFDPSIVDVQGVITHELGHAIGLAHSRHRSATMFFSGGDATLRSLDPDDVAAVCYIYGDDEYISGGACDSCNQDAQCGGSGSRCLHFPSKNGFCAPRCNDDKDCPGGFTCIDIPKVKSRHCLPNNGHCAETGQNIETGTFCYGNATCKSDYCLTTPYSAYCTDFCDLDAGSDCGSGFLCSPITAGACLAVTGGMQCGLCLQFGTGQIGDPCVGPADCQHALCLTSLGQKGRCSATCAHDDAGCPPGSECALGLCVVPGVKPTGATCSSPFECQGAYCVPLESTETRCSAVCDKTSPCPSNSTCAEFDIATMCVSDADCDQQRCAAEYGICTCESDDDCGPNRVCGFASDLPNTKVCKMSLCVLLNKKAKPGEYCLTDGQCVSGALCDRIADDWGVCFAACTPGTDAGCINALCEWTAEFDSDGYPIGRCGPSTGGGTKGQSCALDDLCERNLVCATVDTMGTLCYQDCLVSDGSGCKDGDVCVDAAHPTYPGRGVCLAESMLEFDAGSVTVALVTPQPMPEPDAGQTDIFSAGVDMGPPGGADLTGSDYPPLSMIRNDTDDDGCHISSGTGRLVWYLGCFIGFAVRKRPSGRRYAISRVNKRA